MTGLACRELAPGQPGGRLAVLAHGLEDSWESWLPLAKQISPQWRLVALDLPWRPGNDYQWRRRSSSALLADALDLVGQRPDLIIAHSYGANALLELLSIGDPRTSQAAALICPLYRPPEVAVTWKIFDRSRSAFEKHIKDSLLSRLSGRAERIGADVVENMIGKAIDRVGPAGFLAVFDQFVSSAAVALGEISASVLVLAGGADPTLSPQAATSLARRIPHASLLIDDEYDHFCYVQRPGEVADRIIRFADALAPVPYQRSGP
ncbi:alpha/beta fold hydrolase [Catelliglobosispora koreensis]|uniref:alpha/beta fold hydrolase n=1 Tax=Catelliglobosispora koreensis TaxID=129052 RepID=UPI00037D4162|nr:alpha/beta fold hydrolase [Catelliglobosispora koreensis]